MTLPRIRGHKRRGMHPNRETLGPDRGGEVEGAGAPPPSRWGGEADG